MFETTASVAGRARPVILHVDDSDANRYVVSRVLTQAGFAVVEGVSGRDALEKVAQNPDVVVLDVRLPDISGVEVCRQIKSDPATSAIPVLHLSASYTSGGHKAEGLDAGADAYLVRPVEPIELIATVNALLRQRRIEQALRASEARFRLLADERTRLLEAERAAREDAERANRLKDEFLATLSHELRTPLQSILGWAQILGSGRLAPEDAHHGLETIERNARLQAKLVEDLLDMSRIIAGRLVLDVKRVDPAAMIGAALRAIVPAAEAKGVVLERSIEAPPMTLRGDAARLKQIVANLLSNAVKFTPSGGRVTVSLQREAAHARIVVADTGEGIERSALERIFDRFAQADGSITRRHGGLGLGLAIVRHLVALHGGTVRADSAGIGLGVVPVGVCGAVRTFGVAWDGRRVQAIVGGFVSVTARPLRP